MTGLRFLILSAVCLAAWMPRMAGARTRNGTEACAQAGLKSLVYQNREHCAPFELDPALAPLLAQVRGLNQQAARALRFPKGELPVTFMLHLADSELGALDSAAQDDEIHLGIVPGAAVRQLNSAIYLHELGHVLTMSRSPKLPTYLKAVGDHPLLIEVLSDFLSLSIAKRYMSPFQEIPPCLDRVRYISSGRGQSFGNPLGFFLGDFAARRIVQCCRSKTVVAGFDEYWRGVCERQVSYWDGKFSPLDRRKLDETTVLAGLVTPEQEPIDPHQLSLPINAFATDLAKVVGKDLPDLLQQVLEVKDIVTQPLDCRIRNQPKLSVSMKRVSLYGILRSLRGTLAPGAQKGFDEAWAARGMETLAILEARIPTFALEQAALVKLRAQAKKQRVKRLDETALECRTVQLFL